MVTRFSGHHLRSFHPVEKRQDSEVQDGNIYISNPVEEPVHIMVLQPRIILLMNAFLT